LNLKEEIKKLKNELDVTIVAHFYQKDEVFELSDIQGDSLELAKRNLVRLIVNILFRCGVGIWVRVVKDH